MGVMVYKEGSKPARIQVWEMEGYFSMGWVLNRDGKPAEVKAETEIKVEKEAEVDLEQARLAYADQFGKKPHHKMKLETILEELNGNKPVQPE